MSHRPGIAARISSALITAAIAIALTHPARADSPSGNAPDSTIEIPPAATAPPPESVQPQSAPAAQSSPNPDLLEYEAQSPADEQGPNLQSLQAYVAQGTASFDIGIELREDRRTLKDGEEADGLLIVKVQKGSPAAKAGLHGLNQVVHSVIDGFLIAAAMVFPPASPIILGIPLIDQAHIGESYDMIIGVDGKRVTNVVDFQDSMSQAKAGDMVYLSIVRNGRRKQVSVTVPATTAGN